MTDSTTDASAEGTRLNNSGEMEPPAPAASYRLASYDMSGEKLMVIFNHYEYQDTEHFQKTPELREGTDQDAKALKTTFSPLGYSITRHDDFEHEQILDTLRDVCEKADSSTSCVCVCVLTHGSAGGELCAADRPYPMADLLNILHSAPNLVGKPKLVIVQACRGHNCDAGVCQDGGGGPTLPAHIDTLLLFATVDGYVSWKREKGSLFVEELCRVVKEHRNLDVLHLATVVTARVAQRSVTDVEGNRWKQTLETRFTLTKQLRFTNA